MAEKYIEVLDKIDYTSYYELNYVLTIDIPAELQTYYENKTTLSKTGKLACNLTDTNAVIKAKLLGLWNEFSTEFAASKKWKYYGTYYNGTSWITGGTN